LNTYDGTPFKTPEIIDICNAIGEHIPKTFDFLIEEKDLDLQRLLLKLKEDTIHQLIMKLMNMQKLLIMPFRMKIMIEQGTKNLDNKAEEIGEIILK
jgi:hypothetical protein